MKRTVSSKVGVIAGALPFLLILSLPVSGQEKWVRSLRVELPNQENNFVKKSWPEITTWFWTREEFQPDGYKRVIDRHNKHSRFNLLTASIRYPFSAERYSLSLTDSAVHDQVKLAAAYARKNDIGVVFELAEPFAREAFAEKYPDELQELALFRTIGLAGTGTAELNIPALDLGIYYTPLSWRLIRVYSHPDTSGSVEDITDRCFINRIDKGNVKVSIKCLPADRGRTATVVVAFNILKADIFAPHLIDFEKDILHQYSDVDLAGVCKDEWGYPNRAHPSTDDLWFSKYMAQEYASRRPGHDLVRDMMLMNKRERGREGERIAAINHYMEMYWQRNGEIETEYYNSVKSVFGKDAMIGTHMTWWPSPGIEEIFRNGIHWWVAKRDLAQTDESTPYSVRTALAKKWYSPLWYNMFYDDDLASYRNEIWESVLGGGRLNFHQVFPYPGWQTDTTFKTTLLKPDLMHANSRIHMLNYISSTPVDCRVAVIFGHPAALNWAGSGFGDAGLRITDSLWKLGYYADLIPSSEIANRALKIGEDGSIQYGMQRYNAVIFYHPQFERRNIADFFRAAESGKKTAMFRIGEWTTDFEGRPFDGKGALPPSMRSGSVTSVLEEVISLLAAQGVEAYTPCSRDEKIGDFIGAMAPNLNGHVRLVDGTVIYASGKDDILGDRITREVKIDGKQVFFDAVGVAAVRLDEAGSLGAMAAGGLKTFKMDGFNLTLPARADIALWKNGEGKWQGVLQGYSGRLPRVLSAITRDWVRL